MTHRERYQWFRDRLVAYAAQCVVEQRDPIGVVEAIAQCDRGIAVEDIVRAVGTR